MSWFWFALAAAFFFALSRTFARLYLKKDGHPLAFTAWHNIIAGCCLVPFWFWGWEWQLTLEFGIYLGLIVLIIFLLDWFSFWTLKEIPVATFLIITSCRHVWALLGGIFFYWGMHLSEVV